MLGNSPVANAIGKVLTLFNIQAWHDNSCAILVMADGDNYDLGEFIKLGFKDDVKLIYLMNSDRNSSDLHSLCFLPYFIDTYHIPIEQFSFSQFVGAVGHILGWEDTLVYAPQKRVKPLFARNDLSEMRTVFHLYPCLKKRLDAKVQLYCHKFKNYTPSNKKSAECAESFIKKPTSKSYASFRRLFNDEKLGWRGGLRELNLLLATISSQGGTSSDWPYIVELKDHFKTLDNMKIPNMLPQENQQINEIVLLAKNCKQTWLEMDAIAKKGDF